ncbi:MAG: hypothetical protein PHE89_01105 [Alphaproteobacteria bacterium]|nr:hypothetical protein [Alphaproteobacteria bacterium]
MPMKNVFFRLLIVFSSFVAVSCSSNSEQIDGVKTEQVGVEKLQTVEEVKTKLDAYDSMARAVKYNVDDLNQYLSGKVYDPRLEFVTPNQIIEGLKKGEDKDRLGLYESLRVLDFSVTFAGANAAVIQKNKNSEILFHKSSQSLALNAIKYHERIIYINKKTKEIRKNIAQIQKKVGLLNEKFEQNGFLSQEETEYKKNLEVTAYKFGELNKSFMAEREEYKKLIKAAPEDKIRVEGRQFYEVTGFDKTLTIDIFQKGAINSREEFIDIYSNEKKYAFADVEAISIEKYPDVQTLVLNGYSIGDELYLKALEKRADLIAYNLVKDTLDYRFNSSKRSMKTVVSSFSDNLAIAVFTQIELAYNIIAYNDLAITSLEEDLKATQATLHKLQKEKDTMENELKVYEKRLEVIEMGYQLYKLKADRAAAVRAIYFYAGFEPFNRDLLAKPVKEISKDLKVSFNADVVSSLSRVKVSKEEVVLKENDWAKKDGWLEQLVDGKTSEAGTLPPPPPPLLDLSKMNNKPSIDSAVSPEFYNESHNDRKLMQLGAYADAANATAHWEKVYELYPEIKAYSPKTEEVTVSGRTLYRLVVEAPQGNLVDLCNMMRADGLECILR